MINRLTTARSTVAMRRWGTPGIVKVAAVKVAAVTLAAMAALTAGADARQARTTPTEVWGEAI